MLPLLVSSSSATVRMHHIKIIKEVDMSDRRDTNCIEGMDERCGIMALKRSDEIKH